MSGHRLYQPALLNRQIRALYRLKEATGLPMTYHARVAVDLYLESVAAARKEAAESETPRTDGD